MPLVFIDRNGPPEAMHCPAFLCDVCQEPVHDNPTKGHHGAVVWWPSHEGDRPRFSQLFFVHKLPQSNCIDVLAASMGDREGHESWNDIAEFIEQLHHNTLNPFEAEPGAQYIAPQPNTWTLGSK